jgi:hypothetical protein
MTRAELAGRIVLLRCRLEGARRSLDALQQAAAELNGEPHEAVPMGVLGMAGGVAAGVKRQAQLLERDAEALLAASEVGPS